jgi:hypothetical protein
MEERGGQRPDFGQDVQVLLRGWRADHVGPVVRRPLGPLGQVLNAADDRRLAFGEW